MKFLDYILWSLIITSASLVLTMVLSVFLGFGMALFR